MSATLESIAVACAERRLVPDAVVRAGIRRLLAATLERERAGGAAGVRARRAALLRAMREAPIALHTAEANAQHYELPADYFRLVLGPRLKYSCAHWAGGARTLAEAEDAMLALTSARAGLADGQRILELGCGWGSLTLWIASRYPAARIVAVSNSASQRAFIEARAAEQGLANVQVVTADVNAFEPDGRFDRVVSVEMFEHVRNWTRLLERVASWLTPEGALFLHVFCHREYAYFFQRDGRSDWMARHFFTGGLMPSAHLLADVAGPMRVAHQWYVSGSEYARTCRAWLANHDAHGAEVMRLMRDAYGDEAPAWFARWRIFHMACEELFAYEGGREWLVTHARLVPGDVRA